MEALIILVLSCALTGATARYVANRVIAVLQTKPKRKGKAGRTPMDKPMQGSTGPIRITLACPTCQSVMRVLPGIVAYCENKACPDVLDLCSVTFVMSPLREESDAATPPS